jgi:hypothetical protein
LNLEADWPPVEFYPGGVLKSVLSALSVAGCLILAILSALLALIAIGVDATSGAIRQLLRRLKRAALDPNPAQLAAEPRPAE